MHQNKNCNNFWESRALQRLSSVQRQGVNTCIPPVRNKNKRISKRKVKIISRVYCLSTAITRSKQGHLYMYLTAVIDTSPLKSWSLSAMLHVIKTGASSFSDNYWSQSAIPRSWTHCWMVTLFPSKAMKSPFLYPDQFSKMMHCLVLQMWKGTTPIVQFNAISEDCEDWA